VCSKNRLKCKLNETASSAAGRRRVGVAYTHTHTHTGKDKHSNMKASLEENDDNTVPGAEASPFLSNEKTKK